MLRTGIDVLQTAKFKQLHNRRIGLLSNPSAVNTEMLSTYRLLYEADKINLVALFGAEHGAFGRVEAGETVGTMVDSRTGIPIHSLYGKTYRPSPEMLADIDVMVCDIQDIGVRYYTYLWTMTHIVEACGEADVPVIILDRPNPLGSTLAGCGLDPEFSSLVGRYNILIQHGMTIGEVLLLHNSEWNKTPADLTIIPCENYTHRMIWSDFKRPFIPTSPNIPNISTVQQYVGACLIEGTNLSEGRGTTLPFHIAGAPYIDSRDLANAMNQQNLADVRFRPHQFTPTMSKYSGEACEGVQVHITGNRFDSLSTWLKLIKTVKSLYPEQFAWHAPWSEGDHPPFDKLIGSAKPRQTLNKGASVDDILAHWTLDIDLFRAKREHYLQYE